MTETIEELTRGLNPDDPSTIALVQAANKRPVPAIEKPLGPRTTEWQAPQQTIVYEASGAFSDWNDVARKHPWG